MNTAEFLAALRERNIQIWVEGDNLRCRAPKGALTPELRDALVTRKAEVVKLLQQADSRQRATAPLKVIAREGELPLSFSQERLWFLHEMTPENAAYNIVSSVRFQRALDIPALQRSLDILAARHETLRTRFVMIDGAPSLTIDPPAAVDLPVHDLRSMPASDAQHELGRIRSEHAETPFDLERGPLMRVAFVRVSEQESELLIALHHIISDRWSLGVVTNELQTIYGAIAGGKQPDLPALPFQYVDFAAWQRERFQSGPLEEQLAYWRTHLGGELATLELPLDHARPPQQTYRGAWESRQLSENVAADVKRVSRQGQMTPFMVYLAAFNTLLHRYTGQVDILVGTPIAGRSNQALEGIVGCFLNMLVLRTDMSGSPSFNELLGRVRNVALGAYSNADVPFEQLVADLQPRRDTSRSPLFQVAIAYQSAPKAVEIRGDVTATSSGGTLFDFTLFVTEIEDRVWLTAEYNVVLFEQRTVQRMLAHLEMLLSGGLANLDQSVDELPLLTSGESQQVLRDWNATAVPLEPPATIHGLIEAQTARTPSAVAVSCGTSSCTYAELDARANQLARHLLALGAAADAPVGICLERSIDMLVGVLGILKAGAAYVPLDPSYPADRIEYMLRDGGVSLLVTQSSLSGTLPAGSRAVCIDSDWPAIAAQSSTSPQVPVSGDQLAYIIYTSGSTGRPKGVQVPHRGVVNFLRTMAREPGIGPEDVLAAVTTLSFDIAVLELYLPLSQGARVVIVERDDAIEGARLRALLDERGVTVMQATPATWRLLLEAGWTPGSLKMLCGGEALPRDLSERLVSDGAALWNLYGPTETTVWSTVAEISDSADISVGRPVANTQTYILDRALQPVPVGVLGELYIAGYGVTRGYRGRPDLTAERFLPDPFGPAGSRMYRTGDVARHLRDGRIDCVGRLDHQVKVRGFRIELGEIEGALQEHPAIRHAVVVAHEVDRGDKRLVAYVVYEPNESLTSSELRRVVRMRLPDYMVPAFFVTLERVPLTPNGKVDRRALPPPFEASRATAERSAPVTATEKMLADLWQRALKTGEVSADDNFFDIGGHSLLSMRVVAETNRVLSIRLNPQSMFMGNLRQVAAECDRISSSGRTASVMLGAGA